MQLILAYLLDFFYIAKNEIIVYDFALDTWYKLIITLIKVKKGFTVRNYILFSKYCKVDKAQI